MMARLEWCPRSRDPSRPQINVASAGAAQVWADRFHARGAHEPRSGLRRALVTVLMNVRKHGHRTRRSILLDGALVDGVARWVPAI
jgi:hypothetical protein